MTQDGVQPYDPFDLASPLPNTAEIEGELRPKPRFVDRISKRIIGVVVAFVAFVLLAFFVSLDHMEKRKAQKQEAQIEPPSVSTNETASKQQVVEDVLGLRQNTENKIIQPASIARPSDVIALNPTPVFSATKIRGDQEEQRIAEELAQMQAWHDQRRVPSLGGTTGQIPPNDVTRGGEIPRQKTQQEIEAEEARKARATRQTQARAGGLSATSFNAETAPPVSGSADLVRQVQATLATQGGLPNTSVSPNQMAATGEQDEKLNFLREAVREDRGYHKSVPLPAISRNEIKAGSFIPLTLEQGINSDLPGQITARVTEAIYDTVSGCRLLIPAMSKVIGKYDSKIALGQGRILVVWNSLIFPDGAELNLSGMQGYDTGGMAGFPAEVDNHYLRMFGLTFGLSMLTTGVQLSIPSPNPALNGAASPLTPAQQLATSLAQQYGQLGGQIIGKYMAVQPTLRNFPGEQFTIVVPHTIILEKVWKSRCAGNRSH